MFAIFVPKLEDSCKRGVIYRETIGWTVMWNVTKTVAWVFESSNCAANFAANL